MYPESARASFEAMIRRPEETFDLALTAFLVAAEGDPALDVEAEWRRLNGWAEEFRSRVAPEWNNLQKLARLRSYLFDELGFRGDGRDYYSPSNSLLHEVIRRREGVPLTLSLLFLELLFLSHPLALVFSSDPALIAMAAAMLTMGSWVMIADGSQGMMLSAVRATGDTWIPTLMHFTAYFGVMIPLAWALAFPLKLGASGLFLGILGASVVAVGLLSWRFYQRTAIATPA